MSVVSEVLVLRSITQSSFYFYFLENLWVCVCMYLCEYVYLCVCVCDIGTCVHGVCMAVEWQLQEVGSLLSHLPGFWRSNQVYQAFMARAFTLSLLPILCSLVSQLLVSALGSRFYQLLFLVSKWDGVAHPLDVKTQKVQTNGKASEYRWITVPPI